MASAPRRPAFCGECGAALRRDASFCIQCGTPQDDLPAADPTYQTAAAGTFGAQGAGYADAQLSAAGPYPVWYRTFYPEQQNRVTTFFLLRPILVLPHSIVLALYGIAALVVGAIAWFAILFTGRHPRGLWNFNANYIGWYTNVLTYGALLRDEYPPFGEGDYPVELSIQYPETSNRLTCFFRYFMAIPSALVLGVLQYAFMVTWFIASIAILFTGRQPEGLWAFGQGFVRWSVRLYAYFFLLMDAYPPFSLGNNEAPPRAYA